MVGQVEHGVVVVVEHVVVAGQLGHFVVVVVGHFVVVGQVGHGVVAGHAFTGGHFVVAGLGGGGGGGGSQSFPLPVVSQTYSVENFQMNKS